MLHFTQRIDSLASSEKIQIDCISPNSEANQTAKHSAATLIVSYQGSGSSPSALDSHSQLEWKRYDSRNPNGTVVYSSQEKLLRSFLKIHGGVAIGKDLGDWKIVISRNGTQLSSTTVTVVQPPTASDIWSRRVNNNYTSISSPLVAYTTDDGVLYSPAPYTIPAPSGGSSTQTYKVSWKFISPQDSDNRTDGAYTTVDETYVSDGSVWNTTTVVKSPAYRDGRILTQTGAGTLQQLPPPSPGIVGLPHPGTWKFIEKVGQTASTTTTFEVRQITADASQVLPGAFTDTGLMPYKLNIQTFPATWVPAEIDWTLSLVDGSGAAVKTYTGKITSVTSNNISLVQDWDCKDASGNTVKTGGTVTPVLTVSVPQPPKASAQRAALKKSVASTVGAAPYSPSSSRVSTAVVPSISTFAVPNSTGPSGAQVYPFLYPNDDGSFGNPGDTWVLSAGSEDYTLNSINVNVGITHAGRMVAYANVPGVATTFPGPYDSYIVGSSSAVFDTSTQDVPFVFTSPTSLFNFGISFFDGTGTLTCGNPVNGDLYLTDLTQGKSIIAAQDNTAFGVSCLVAYAPGLYPYYPPDAPPPTTQTSNQNNPLGALIVITLSTCNSASMDSPSSCTASSSPIPIKIMNGSGRYSHAFGDLALPTRGLPLVLGRLYNSEQENQAPRFGWRWTFEDSLTIEPTSGNVFHTRSDGHVSAFTNSGGTFTATEAENRDILTQIDDHHYQIKSKGKVRVVYAVPSGVALPATDFYMAQVSQEIDRFGNTNTFTWDAKGKRLLRMEGPDPSIFLKFIWSNDRGPDKVFDHTGRCVVYNYTSYCQHQDKNSTDWVLSKITQPGNKVYTHGYHKVLGERRYQLLTSSLNDVLQEKVVGNEDTPGILMEVSHLLAAKVAFKRVDSSTSTLTINAAGVPQQVLTYGLDGEEKPIQVTDAANRQASLTLDDQENVTSSTDALGHQTTYTFDSRRNPLTVTDSLGHKTTMTWDDQDNLLSVTDALNQTVTMAYDASSNQISSTDQLSHTSSATYTSFGKMKSSTDALGHTWNFAYNGLGFLASKSAPPSRSGQPAATWVFSVDTLGRTTKTTDPLGRISKTCFDERGRAVETTIPAVSAQFRQCDLPEAKTTACFDNNDLLLSSTAPDGLVTSYSYDKGLKLVSVLSPGHTRPTLLKYDGLERVVQMTNSNGQSTSYQRDSLNRLV
ncbi:unnamed protein product, partial [Phaeothamnion confervicola]